MRPLNHLRSSCLILLSLAFPAPLSLANARSLNLQSTPSLPFQLLPYLPSVQDDRWLLTKIRDGVIHTIWGIQSGRSSKHCNANSISSRPLPPPSVLARYDGDVVLRFSINTAQEVKDLAEAINVLFLDVWEFTSEWVDIRLAKDVVPSLLGLLPASLQHSHTPLMHDLARTIYESYPSSAVADSSPTSHSDLRGFNPSLRTSPEESNIFFHDYQPLSVILPWMRLLSSLFPTHVRMINIGTSYEGRDIPALRVGVHPTNSEQPLSPRKTIIIAGGSHAREWISTSTVNYIAYSFITGYGKAKKMTKMIEEFDWIFIPTLNPDGYVYTWENDRLWRKNRQQTNLRFCKGLDLDRAYGYEWDGEMSKSNPCSESFSGDGPFEGVESRRFANWVKNETESNNVEFVGFLDLHSYSQQVLYPYSYSCSSTPPSLENLEELAMGLAKAIHHATGAKYGVTSACEGSVVTNAKSNQNSPDHLWPRIETGGGSALDWFYHEMHVRYAFQIKLRDTGSYGFLLPSKNIVPTGKEALSAVEYFGDYMMGNKGIERLAPADSPAHSETSTEGTDDGDTMDMDEVSFMEEGEEEDFPNPELRRKRR